MKYLVGFEGQYSVEPGQERDVSEAEATRLVERGLAELVPTKAPRGIEVAEASPKAERAVSLRGKRKT